jgi:hypothetical protein
LSRHRFLLLDRLQPPLDLRQPRPFILHLLLDLDLLEPQHTMDLAHGQVAFSSCATRSNDSPRSLSARMRLSRGNWLAK